MVGHIGQLKIKFYRPALPGVAPVIQFVGAGGLVSFSISDADQFNYLVKAKEIMERAEKAGKGYEYWEKKELGSFNDFVLAYYQYKKLSKAKVI